MSWRAFSLVVVFSCCGVGACQHDAVVESTQTEQVAARAAARPPVVLSAEALRIHRAGLLIDGHNDLPDKLRDGAGRNFEKLDISRPQKNTHTDIPRLRKGGVGAQFWAAYIPAETMHTGGSARYALEQIDLIHRMVRHYSQDFEMAYTADDVERIHRAGRIAALIGIEGGHALEHSLAVVRMFYALGGRYITLTHTDTNDWADSATDQPRHGGLSPFGEEVVREMNRLGMLVDISHVSAAAMRDVLRISQAPVIASHSSAYAIAAHARNVPDDVLRLLKKNGGVVMVNFFSGYVDPVAARVMQDLFQAARDIRAQYPDEDDFNQAWQQWRRAHPYPTGSVHTVVDHIDHIVKVAGIDHAGLGSDFDGVSKLPTQLDDVSCYPYITQELLNRGYTAEDIHKIMGRNLLRALRQAEECARRMGSEP
ncbi:MAG: dipeptidase [Planctomycetes bacterium]|nr:dipeptidase [Planctomycetota bacterium]